MTDVALFVVITILFLMIVGGIVAKIMIGRNEKKVRILKRIERTLRMLSDESLSMEDRDDFWLELLEQEPDLLWASKGTEIQRSVIELYDIAKNHEIRDEMFKDWMEDIEIP